MARERVTAGARAATDASVTPPDPAATKVISTRSRPRPDSPLRGLRRAPSGGGPGARAIGWITSAPVVSWVTARLVVGAALAFSHFLATRMGTHDPLGRGPTGLLGWDAEWYLRIAMHGYAGSAPEAMRFFPLLPLLAKPLAWIAGPRLALLAVTNVASLVAGVLLHRLALLETGDRRLADRAAWLIALLPPAFVLVMGYAESLMLVLSIGAFLAMRSDRWHWAVVAGFLGGLTRPLGVLLVLPAGWEAWRGWSAAPPRDRARRVAAVASPVAGLAVYLLWSWAAVGDALRPLRLQQDASRRGGFANPFGRLAHAGSDLLSGRDLGSGLHLPWAILFVGLLVVLYRRWPASYALFATVIVAVAVSASNLDSLERYGLSAFPLALALADLVRPPWAERAVFALAASGMAIYATLAFLGAYVP
ncbi:MAG TPA: mannosyltransferase family protein [Acidimicrobiales bacterium]|nr:mannosyltransferase family protein [Acidimicrobiales bacterium]